MCRSCPARRVKGVEPSSVAWKATALPLSYTRVELSKLPRLQVPAKCFFHGITTCQSQPSPLALSYETNRSSFLAGRQRFSSRGSYSRSEGGHGWNARRNDDQLQRRQSTRRSCPTNLDDLRSAN